MRRFATRRHACLCLADWIYSVRDRDIQPRDDNIRILRGANSAPLKFGFRVF